jgi:glycine/D-amino acid oxidase-like deaminating enzyme
MLPGYAQTADLAAIGGRVGFRPLSPDRLPMIGAVGRRRRERPAYRPSRRSLPCRACPVST